MSDSAQIIRGVLIQVADARLLLPNATIAEVLSFSEPDQIAGALGYKDSDEVIHRDNLVLL